MEQEIEREQARLEKERQHYLNALAALEANGDTEGADRMRAQLDDVDKAIEDVDYRAANVRAGYVYVISNVGAFGERMVKVGMTRRLEPMDRIRELSDASVPFNFDVHALFFSEDAVGIEAEMHRPAGRPAREPGQPAPRVLLRDSGRGPRPAQRTRGRAPPVRGATRGGRVPPEPLEF